MKRKRKQRGRKAERKESRGGKKHKERDNR